MFGRIIGMDNDLPLLKNEDFLLEEEDLTPEEEALLADLASLDESEVIDKRTQ